MYVGNTLYVQASEGGKTYKVTQLPSGVAFSCAFIKEPIEVDGCMQRCGYLHRA